MADFYILWIYLMISCIVSSLSFFIHIILKFKRQNPPNSRSHLSHVFLQRNGEYRSNLIVEILFLILGLIFSWYAISIGFTIFNKWLLNEFRGGFRYPLITTTIHMFMKYTVSRLYYNHYYGIPSPSVSSSSLSSSSSQPINNNANRLDDFNFRASSALVFVIVLIGFCTSADVALSNESILFINVTLYTTLKATVVIFTFCWAILFQIETFRWPTALAITCVFIGVGIALLSTAQFSIFGVSLALLASCVAGLRWTLLQYLLLSDPLSASNSLIALYRFSLYAFISILPIAMYVEGYSLIQSIFFNHPLFLLEALALSVFGGILSLFLIVTEVQLVQLTSSLTLGVAGNIKEIIQIGLAMMVYKDQVNARTISGIILTLIAAQYYSYLQNKYKVKDYPQYYYWYANQYSVSQTLNPHGSRYDQYVKTSTTSSGSRSGTAGGNGVVKHRRKHKHRLPHRLRGGGKVFVNTLESIEEHPSETSSVYDSCSPVSSPLRIQSSSKNNSNKQRFSTTSNTSSKSNDNDKNNPSINANGNNNASDNNSSNYNNGDNNSSSSSSGSNKSNSNSSMESSKNRDKLLLVTLDQIAIDNNNNTNNSYTSHHDINNRINISSSGGDRLLFSHNNDNNDDDDDDGIGGTTAGRISPNNRIKNTSAITSSSPYKRSFSLTEPISHNGSSSGTSSSSSSSSVVSGGDVNNPLHRLHSVNDYHRDDDDDEEEEDGHIGSDEDGDGEYGSGSSSGDDDSGGSYEEDESPDFDEELQGSSNSGDGTYNNHVINRHHHGLTLTTTITDAERNNDNNDPAKMMDHLPSDDDIDDDDDDNDDDSDQTQFLLPVAAKRSRNNNNSTNNNNNLNNITDTTTATTKISPRLLLGAGGNTTPKMIPLLRSFSDESYDNRKGSGRNNTNNTNNNNNNNSTSDVLAAMLMSPSRATAFAGLNSLALMVGLTSRDSNNNNNNNSASSTARSANNSCVSIPTSKSKNRRSSSTSSSSSSSGMDSGKVRSKSSYDNNRSQLVHGGDSVEVNNNNSNKSNQVANESWTSSESVDL